MRIGVDARVLTLSELRGIANYMLEIFKFWPSENDEFFLFHEFGAITPELETSAKITSIKVPEPPGTRFKVWQWLGLPQALKQQTLDLFWSPANIPVASKQVPQVLTIHDTLLQEDFRDHSFFDSLYYRRVVPYWAKKYVNKVITVSSYSKDRIISKFCLEPSRIDVVYNGLPSVFKTFQSRDAAYKSLYERQIVPAPYIYALGASSSWKNTDLLLRAFALVLKKCPHLFLVVSGIQDNVKLNFIELATTLGIDKNVKLEGFVGSDIRNTLYQGAVAFVYPSLFEGFGFPPIEAMSLGCPVISSIAASIPEVVGSASVQVDCANENKLAAAIADLAMDEVKQNKLVRLGHDNITRFSWKECAMSHRQIFLENIKK